MDLQNHLCMGRTLKNQDELSALAEVLTPETYRR